MRRFIDPEVEFIFVPAGNVPSVQAEQGAIAFDAPDAKYPHKNAEGLCSFAALVQERFSDDPILMEMARIVQAADFKDHLDDHPAERGLQFSALLARIRDRIRLDNFFASVLKEASNQ